MVLKSSQLPTLMLKTKPPYRHFDIDSNINNAHPHGTSQSQATSPFSIANLLATKYSRRWSHSPCIQRIVLLVVVCLSIAILARQSLAAVPLKTICRVKGQEENTLHGLGLVVGLKGTGDGGSFLPTIRSMGVALEMMGNPLGNNGLSELKDAKNVALVMVTATVPAAGARQGDKVDCTVHSVGSAKSLAGGTLFLTPLVGPDPQDPRVYALAEGPITLDAPDMSTTGRVHAGCRFEADFFNPFVKDGRITLVLEPAYADFQVAQETAEMINSQMSVQTGGVPVAKALNQLNIEVLIPRQYAEDSVLFVSQLLALPLMNVPIGPRVVINERSGTILIGGDVEIAPVVVTHKNMVIQAGVSPSQFVAMDSQQTQNPTLKSLVDALNALNTPPQDIITIIKGLERDGKLRAQLILQ